MQKYINISDFVFTLYFVYKWQYFILCQTLVGHLKSARGPHGPHVGQHCSIHYKKLDIPYIRLFEQKWTSRHCSHKYRKQIKIQI